MPMSKFDIWNTYSKMRCQMRWVPLLGPCCCCPCVHLSERREHCICLEDTVYICVYMLLKTIIGHFPCVLTDLVQPAKRGSAGNPEEEADHSAAARHRLLFCADKQRQYCWGSAAAGVHPHCPWPDQDQAQHTSGSGWQDDNQPA